MVLRKKIAQEFAIVSVLGLGLGLVVRGGRVWTVPGRHGSEA